MLRLENVTYSYPGQAECAVQGVSLAVKPGELVLCTGRSGCGKSTLVRLVSGLAPHFHGGRMEGRALVGGVDNASRSLTAISEDAGVLFQNPETQFFALTVADEAAVGLECRGRDEASAADAVQTALNTLGLGDIAERSVLHLSEGQKQKVALAGLLALSPKALVLDEPSANLDPEAARGLAQTLIRLKQSGMALLVTDHRLAWLRDVADRVLVMDGGEIAAQGEFAILDDASLRARHGLRDAQMVDGRESLPALPAPLAENADCGAGLHVEKLSFGFRKADPLFNDAAAHFPRGRITALLGPNGCGKTTLARLAAGLLASKEARFAWDGEALPKHLRPRRIGLVLQNADHQLRMRSVRSELADALAGLPRSETEPRIDAMLAEYGLTGLAERHPQSLSGGEKQRLSVAAAMIRKPDAVFLDEPTSGLDGENMRRMGRDLRRAADAGAAVVVITHDLEFMHSVCDAKLTLPL